MDPNAALHEIRGLAGLLNGGIGKHHYNSLDRYQGDVDDLCDLVQALDEWLSNGGSLPRGWQEEVNR